MAATKREKGKEKGAILVGRFWRDGEKSDVFSGYMEAGVLGRFHNVRFCPNDKKEREGDCDYVMIIRLESTPLGMLRYLSNNVQKALYQDDEEDDESTDR